MNLILLIGFGYFCFNQVILTSTGKIENGNIPEEIFKLIEFPLCGHEGHKTQLMDLNDDCQFLVLKQLDFISLLSVAETNNQFKSLVSIILEQIFRKKLVIIVLSSVSKIEITDDYIIIKNFAIAEKVLNNFGHLIQKLKLSRIDSMACDALRSIHDLLNIYKLVNLHCSKTLSEIWLYNSLDNFLDEFTNQFENVQNVFIQLSLQTDRRLNEVFPSVRRLDFLIYKISNTNSINVKYENLEHLNIYMNLNGGPLSEGRAAVVIRKNPHIRSVGLRYASPELTKIAADSLPKLKKLKLQDVRCEHSNQLISFPNVEIFETSESTLHCLFLNLKFGNVEEVHVDYLADSMFGETGFFATNKNLKKLQFISSHMYLNIDENLQIENLVNANTTLQDIFIKRAYRLDSYSILQLIENSKQLEKLQIDLMNCTDNGYILNELRKEINDTWSIKAFSNTIILKR